MKHLSLALALSVTSLLLAACDGNQPLFAPSRVQAPAAKPDPLTALAEHAAQEARKLALADFAARPSIRPMGFSTESGDDNPCRPTITPGSGYTTNLYSGQAYLLAKARGGQYRMEIYWNRYDDASLWNPSNKLKSDLVDTACADTELFAYYHGGFDGHMPINGAVYGFRVIHVENGRDGGQMHCIVRETSGGRCDLR